MPDGTVVHVRMAKPRSRRCTVCNGLTPGHRLRECDGRMADGRTCNRLMCTQCARRGGANIDFCPEHVRGTP